MKKILIDGTNLSTIHFIANPSLNSNGEPVGMAKGFLSAVRTINKLFTPDSIIVFFDGPGGSLQRRQIFKEYKSGRKPRTLVGQAYQYLNEDQAKANQDWQMRILKNLLDCCAINVIETENYEADDGIAYLCNSLLDSEQAIIISCDKDFLQLISERVNIYNPLSKKLIGIKEAVEQFEIHPNNWLFYRAVSGDKSDNLPGVPGFGPKTLNKMFLLHRDNKIELDIISESILLLESEQKLDDKEKTILKRLKSLQDNLDIIKRNYKLMSLKDPMMSNNAKDKIDFQINSFKPLLKPKNFYIENNNSNLNMNPGLVGEFTRLTIK